MHKHGIVWAFTEVWNLHWYCDGCNQSVGQVTEELCRIKQCSEQEALEVNEMKEEIKLLKADSEVLNKQFKTETVIVDKKLKQNTDENAKKIAKVEAAQRETRNNSAETTHDE